MVNAEFQRTNVYEKIINKNKDSRTIRNMDNIKNISRFIQKHIKENEISVKDLNNRKSILSIFQKFHEEKRRIIFSLDYFQKKTGKAIGLNLTAELGEIHQKNFIILQSIQPDVDIVRLAKTGESMNLVFDYGNKCYTCKVIIVAVNKNKMIVCELPQQILQQKRQYYRVSISEDDKILAYVKFNGYSTIPIKIGDISEKGVALFYNRDLKVGTSFLFHIDIMNNHILCNGIIKNSAIDKMVFRYGSEINPDEKDSEKIVTFVLKKKSEILLNST